MLGSGKSTASGSREPRRKGAEKAADPIKRLGLLDNEDVRVMMQGCNMVKVRSSRWQKSRNLRLLDDGLTVWCESTKISRKAKTQQTFAVAEVECVREGCQSEALRRLSGSVPESKCFTVVFRGARKSLDLLCPCEEDARRWVRGLRSLKEHVADMTQKQKLDQYPAPCYLRRADQNQDGKMSYDEVKRLLQMINIDLSEQYARCLFKRCDRSGDDRLDHIEIEEFCRELLRRPELDAVFRHYSSNGCVLATAELRDFLGDQGEDASLNHAQSLILTYELNDWAQKNHFMTQNGFTMYMLSRENDVVNPDHAGVYQDMSRPLAHYFISSSHNTYLTKDQVTGASSTEPYIRALNQGCRCVELDCWDGDKGEPVIYHGHTLTSKVPFKEVIETIAQYAFKASPYPLILSLENHCSVEQQVVMANDLRTILGSRLLTKPLSAQPPKDLPSPEELKGRILVKGKKLIPHLGQLSKDGSCASFSSSSEDEPASSNKNTSKKDPAKVCSKLSPELSELAVYCRSVPFRGFENPSEKPPNEMSSFSESDALRLIKDSGKLFVRHNSRQLSRIYPSGQRLQSSNYDPQEMWNGGCQMVALNFQTSGEQMDLNQGRFLPNGRCGYVLKPSFLRSPTSDFNPEITGGGPGHIPTQLTIRIISAQQLPKINTEKASSIVDPQVWVEIHGVDIDNARDKTHRIDNNGFNPRWDCTLSFQLQVPELALVRFMVEDHDHTAKNDFVGQFTLPFISLRKGYRHVHLLKADGSSLSPGTLFIHVKVTRKVPVKTVSERMAIAKGKA
ncbi:1-phosphatidylinositol 4,5-bisphosphate phosphodiesterase delta-3-A [Liparis tanakae]|uniref:Phosphoinositide phospholipase C n=1 Tax=Liparis tanakae TaxID=230148 RepID=A0A4Z2J7F3_9TELE|nr:1-phosphatidylinositol 4,5-bisphosphate phosphodiesterase delta-3-A [Liparis tanakae]